jgi:hypothetical protein
VPINLKQCDGICTECIKSYIDKHRLKTGQKFDIPCLGIPKEYIPENVLASLGTDPTAALAMVDPVAWAAEFLDWHCIDPIGEIWKRKSYEGTNGSAPKFDPSDLEHIRQASEGKSPYHRPYQKMMLACSSKRKIFRLGRQLGKTESLVISMLFNLFTHEKYAVEVLAPYQSQIDLIFGRLNDLIGSNNTLSNSIERSVKAPNYQIKLKNDSYVIGFTAGTRSGQEAGAARGQHANMLVFDEADYLSPKDIDSALAVIINHPDATVWMSSTPTGRREKFYDSCQDIRFKEFHFSSQVNPNWTEEHEKFFRSQLTEDGYKHEIAAEFGDQEEGVYQQKYIEAAQKDYQYGSYNPMLGWSYTIGVDWNDVKIGTTIAVIGYNPRDGHFYLVDKSIISKSERTQLTACDEIAKLNRKWCPEYIYVDVGYGHTQIEVLHDFGLKMRTKQGANSPDSRLCTIVKGFDFGSSIVIRDPFTHEEIKKSAKPFLVENSVRRFENYSFCYPSSDESFTKQLQGYIIKRVSNTGRPVYEARETKVGDHFLDAVNLALVAFALEKGAFGNKSSYSALVAFAGRPGATGEVAGGERRDSLQFVADRQRPDLGRADIANPTRKLITSPFGDIPASNLAHNKVSLWNWPGFSTDQPRPITRTYPEAVKQVERRVRGPQKSKRPQRSKF